MTQSTESATMKLFLRYGDPNRLRTLEISNWNGKAVVAPRTELDEFLERPELSKAGVYILTGQDPATGRSTCYVGEGEVIKTRIRSHHHKEFWVRVCAIVSNDENLTKSHIRYLEGRLIEEVKRAGRAVLDNSASSGSKLPESDEADMEVFLGKIRQLLPVLGIDVLVATPRQEERPSDGEEDLQCQIKGLVATGRRTPNGFVVFEGSQAVVDMRPSAASFPWIVEERERLIRDEVLVAEGDHMVFTKDVEFSSPSLAAGVVVGGSANGLTEWKAADGTTLKDLEKKELQA